MNPGSLEHLCAVSPVCRGVTFIEATSATVARACGNLSKFPIKINSLKKYLKGGLVHGASDEFAPAEITGRTKDPVETDEADLGELCMENEKEFRNKRDEGEKERFGRLSQRRRAQKCKSHSSCILEPVPSATCMGDETM